ncbi:hypothetical protein PHYPSEUDO_006361 [Phytophthora pseudosyringae]|uniref:RxLR effector protein n=1 Tax=Phytophthora pseudosyringae TaxID=221518 RepID=A0A8T1WB69_9STRA|nr:hypothetical protein PHYPSEUDO_006361 [Phytophthora pseudosyringae]
MKISTATAFIGMAIFLVAAPSQALEGRQLRGHLAEELQADGRILAADGIEETAGGGWNVLLEDKKRKFLGQQTAEAPGDHEEARRKRKLQGQLALDGIEADDSGELLASRRRK